MKPVSEGFTADGLWVERFKTPRGMYLRYYTPVGVCEGLLFVGDMYVNPRASESYDPYY